jgi:hypothetical protein
MLSFEGQRCYFIHCVNGERTEGDKGMKGINERKKGAESKHEMITR